MNKRIRNICTAIVAALLWVALPSLSAEAASYRTCFRLAVDTTDSTASGGEDRLAWANTAGSQVTAYGIAYYISSSSGQYIASGFAEPTTGCANWDATGYSSFHFTVSSVIKDQNGNIYRFHDGDDKDFSVYPGSPFAWYKLFWSVSPGTHNLLVGGSDPISTATAAAAIAARYFPTTNQNAIVEYASGCDASSAHYDGTGIPDSFSYTDATPYRTYLRLDGGVGAGCLSGDDQRRRKFLVTHEMGHGNALLGAANGLGEPGADTTYAPATGDPCTFSGSPYSHESSEWNVINWREGFAHFFATVAFNKTSQSNGTFQMWNGFANTDTEFNSPHSEGGRFKNNCWTIVLGGATPVDVLRTLWDWTTPTSASNRASQNEVFDSYVQMLQNGGLTKSNYWTKFRAAASSEVSTAVKNKLDGYACWNGTEFEVGNTTCN